MATSLIDLFTTMEPNPKNPKYRKPLTMKENTRESYLTIPIITLGKDDMTK